MSNNDSFIRIAELIGEMAWGIDLPPVFSVEVLKPFPFEGEPKDHVPVEIHVLPPLSTKPIFDAIYHKLKKAPDYNPMPELRRENAEQARRIDELTEENRKLKIEVAELTEQHERNIMERA